METEIYLCFEDYGDNKKCRKSTGALDDFSSVASSQFDHDYVRIAASEGEAESWLEVLNVIQK